MTNEETNDETRETQYQDCISLRDSAGFSRFGIMSNFVWYEDPKRIVFVVSRYKFVAKMLSGKKRALEVGCADAFATRIVAQEVEHVTAVDFDPVFIEDAKDRGDGPWKIDYQVHDMLEGPVGGEKFDATYAVDVLEHIEEKDEDTFLGNMVESLTPEGVLIVGTPSLESQEYASPQSKAGHVNCKTGETMRETLSRHFHNVFIFSMNDEVVHTGFHKMAHYVFGIGATRR